MPCAQIKSVDTMVRALASYIFMELTLRSDYSRYCCASAVEELPPADSRYAVGAVTCRKCGDGFDSDRRSTWGRFRHGENGTTTEEGDRLSKAVRSVSSTIK